MRCLQEQLGHPLSAIKVEVIDDDYLRWMVKCKRQLDNAYQNIRKYEMSLEQRKALYGSDEYRARQHEYWKNWARKNRGGTQKL